MTESNDGSTLYCVCQQLASGVMIECVRGNKCNGWVHPACCGLKHTADELSLIGDYICSLCALKEDDYNALNAVDTNLANAALDKKRALSKDGWSCERCTFWNNRSSISTCGGCERSRDDDDDFEDDVDSTFKRRSKRSRKSKSKQSYQVPNSGDEDLLDDSDSDNVAQQRRRSKKSKKSEEPVDDEPTPPAYVPVELVVEKILEKRKCEVDVEGPSYTYKRSAFEYFIKWKNFSYLHCSWEVEDRLLEMDPNNKQKIRRYEDKIALGPSGADEEDVYNPDFVEIDRILADRVDEPMPHDPAHDGALQDDGKRYYVKWRTLPYMDATWERGCDLQDDEAVKEYHRINKIPPTKLWEPLPRPAVRDYKKISESPNFGKEGNLKLREYQLEGLNWLLWNFYNHRPSILADEMGLGKTIQTLAFLDLLRSHPSIQSRGPFLVVAPLSLIAQWQSECTTWTDMNCIVYHGNNESREIIQNFEFHFFDGDKPDKKKPYKFNILVTTYEIAMKDIRLLTRIHWRCLVVDEAHRLKNQKSRLVDNLRGLKRDHCVLLTGTPLQNRTEELWALLNFLDSPSFPDVESFMAKFGDLQDSTQVADLHKMLKPFLLRRVKEDVEKSLPPKEETIVEVELTAVQKQWYRAIYERNTSFLFKGASYANSPNLMNVMMELRKCCNHPYLNNGVEDRITQSEKLVTDAMKHDMMVKCSGKMVLLDKLLPKLKEDGHKVLIFSQMVRVLDILEDYLRFVGYGFERLDGHIRGNLRQTAIDRFVNPDYNRFVMLLSTKAGGLGLNLTAADTVVIFDSDWNPQNDLQAQARAHRIGQTQSVKIYRLITRKTYEMHMFHRASLKLGLDQAVLTHMRQENEKNDKSKKYSRATKVEESREIEQLLKKGAYDVFREDDSAAEQFCAADIDVILQRSSQVLQYASEARSTFSKASFVAANTENDVDIDDPDFWKKAIGLDEPEETVEEELLPQQRRRTRVTRFGQSNDYMSEEDINDIDDSRDDAGGVGVEPELSMAKSREWTVNGRERCQRALTQYGFGRWDTVRVQSGSSRSQEEVDTFSRALVMHCALICAEIPNPSGKEDSPFIKGAIQAAQSVQAEYFGSGTELPSILSEADFVSKLKQGAARRFLIRLDQLNRLQRLIRESCEILVAKEAMRKEGGGKEPVGEAEEDVAKFLKPISINEIDDCIDRFGIDAVSKHITIVDVGERPSWSQLTSWWDGEADRHLLIGIFMHGYGRCAQVLSDARFCFKRREIEAMSKKSSQVALSSSTETESFKETKKEEVELEGKQAEGGDSEKANDLTNGHASSLVTDVSALKTLEAKKNGEDVEEDPDAFIQPDASQMNRLLLWLISAEYVKRQQDKEDGKKERLYAEKKRLTDLEKKRKKGMDQRAGLKVLRAIQMDMLRHDAILYNDHRRHVGLTIKWSRRERRSLCYTIAALGAPNVLIHGDAHPNELAWEDVVRMGHLQKEPDQVLAFFKDRLYPKCISVSTVKIDPLAQDSKSASLDNERECEYVDVFESTYSHGLKAQRLALLCIRRTQLLSVARFVLHNRYDELLVYLKSTELGVSSDLPVWWRPEVHDLGYIHGVVKYGIFNLRQILADPSLPFTRAAISKFLIANDPSPQAAATATAAAMDSTLTGVAPTSLPSEATDHVAAQGTNGSKEGERGGVAHFFRTATNEIVPASHLEVRLQHICAFLTKDRVDDETTRIAEPKVLDIPPTDALDSFIYDSEPEVFTSEARAAAAAAIVVGGAEETEELISNVEEKTAAVEPTPEAVFSVNDENKTSVVSSSASLLPAASEEGQLGIHKDKSNDESNDDDDDEKGNKDNKDNNMDTE